MSITRRDILKSTLLGIPALQFGSNPLLKRANEASLSSIQPIAVGPFEGTRTSLRKYKIPDWFRDAKFGIWAHWGPQSAVEYGDWYARNMYLEGNHQYNYHLKTYGHPSKFGFKDTIPQWKAEQFDADYLLGLYKKAGAKYFMTMGVHHDNFDLWNSTHNKWNAVNMGPKKDIVGMFKKAAQKHGLKFAISDHLWITYKWFSASKGSDKKGEFKGVPYDGANPKNFDYYGVCEEVYGSKLDWNENGIPDKWKQHWFNRIKDLVDKYEPDMLYCDGHLPFEDWGLNLVAHLYNKKAKGNITEAVYTSKRPEDGELCVFDVEKGVVETIWPQAWQTDTCIGDWHYNKERVGKYKSPKFVIDMLVDIVSRNGNLMLNFPLPSSGMLDKSELELLEAITSWMSVNSEAIYSTRPWKIYGEGPQSKITNSGNEVNSAQQFNEGSRKFLNHEDVRFTTKGSVLYAFFMGWPDNGSNVVIRPLSNKNIHTSGSIGKVELLGHGAVNFRQDEIGLHIVLPENKPCEHAYALRISGTGLS